MASNVTDVIASSDAYVSFKIAVDVYVVSLLSVFGISGNVISILVLGRDNSVKRTTGFLLQMLALADVLYLVTCLFFQTIQTIADVTDWSPGLKYYYPWIVPFIWPLASIAQTAAVWLVVIVTADRFVAICKPLHAPQYSTTSRARKAVVLVWILSVVYNVPRFFERTTRIQTDPDAANATYPKVEKTPLWRDAVYFLVYKTCLFFIVRYLIPLSALAFFNTRLIQAIRESQKIREKSVDGYRKERYTLTLVVVVIVFALCETPDFLLRVWFSLSEYAFWIPSDITVLRYMNAVTNLLLTINSCVNFVIYCFLGQKFRRILRQMICGQTPGATSRLRLQTIRNGEQTELADEVSTLVGPHRDPSAFFVRSCVCVCVCLCVCVCVCGRVLLMSSTAASASSRHLSVTGLMLSSNR
ncbi:hypothetical protein LSH36_519g01002 [Paralvinella palmiformis]|uniref:G-protein coupled receptors family 1 profile domain-containing protein n=1 Tax=Paralvinella palmiformis TaxID=53620 RepID=A0AAD9J7Q6_9ANNE|nr:hypothetical protein LSH36_519g01002 [Paralvinella palmiformis]